MRNAGVGLIGVRPVGEFLREPVNRHREPAGAQGVRRPYAYVVIAFQPRTLDIGGDHPDLFEVAGTDREPVAQLAAAVDLQPRLEKRLEWPMLVAALLVVPAIAIEQSEATGALNTIAVVINWATWLAFVAEGPDARRC